MSFSYYNLLSFRSFFVLVLFVLMVTELFGHMCLSDASKSGVAQEAMHSLKRGIRGLTEPEARQILGVTDKSSWGEVLKVCFSFSLLASLHFFC